MTSLRWKRGNYAEGWAWYHSFPFNPSKSAHWIFCNKRKIILWWWVEAMTCLLVVDDSFLSILSKCSIFFKSPPEMPQKFIKGLRLKVFSSVHSVKNADNATIRSHFESFWLPRQNNSHQYINASDYYLYHVHFSCFNVNVYFLVSISLNN